MESPLAVANYFVQKSFDTGIELTPMKLVKLVYIAHGWHLGLGYGPLLTEPVLAWRYGPVVETVYQHFRKFADHQIKQMAVLSDHEGNTIVPKVDESEVGFLDRIWEVYKGYTGFQLSSLTHQVGTPWYLIWHAMGGKEQKPSLIIPNDTIKGHYESKIMENNAGEVKA